MSSGLERSSQGSNFVDNATQRPYITLFIIFLVRNLLWAHIVWRADMSVGKDGLGTHDSRQAEIAQLHVVVGVEEDITRF